MALLPYPGASAHRGREQAGGVTVTNWDLTSRCHCDGKGGYVFDEFVVDFNVNVHIRSALPAKILSWAVRGEGDHVHDLFFWADGEARQVASELETDLKGTSFFSEADCQFSTTQQLNAALMNGGIKQAYDVSAITWDVSKLHTWENPRHRP
jgi:hypothetical protein